MLETPRSFGPIGNQKDEKADMLAMWFALRLNIFKPFGNTSAIELMEKSVHDAWQPPPVGPLEALPSHKVWLP